MDIGYMIKSSSVHCMHLSAKKKHTTITFTIPAIRRKTKNTSNTIFKTKHVVQYYVKEAKEIFYKY